jgi:hypothetical protein
MSAETADLTPAMLAGTPVGGPGGDAACDICNRRLSDGERRADAPDAEADTVYAYATMRRPQARCWVLRRVTCENCGPPGDSEPDEPDETVAKATLGYDVRIGAFALADLELPTDDAETAVEGGDGR